MNVSSRLLVCSRGECRLEVRPDAALGRAADQWTPTVGSEVGITSTRRGGGLRCFQYDKDPRTRR